MPGAPYKVYGPADFYNQAYDQAQSSRELDMRMQQMRQQQVYQNLMLQQQMLNSGFTNAHLQAETNMMGAGGPEAMAMRRDFLNNGGDPSQLPPMPGFGNAQTGGTPSNQPAPGLNGPVGSDTPNTMTSAAAAYAPQSWRQNAGGQKPVLMPQTSTPSIPQGLSGGTGLPAPDAPDAAPLPVSSAAPSPNALAGDPEIDSALGLGAYAAQGQPNQTPAPPPGLAAAMPQAGGQGDPGALMPPGMAGNAQPHQNAPTFMGEPYNPQNPVVWKHDANGKLLGKITFMGPQQAEFQDMMGRKMQGQTDYKQMGRFQSPDAITAAFPGAQIDSVDYDAPSGGLVPKGIHMPQAGADLNPAQQKILSEESDKYIGGIKDEVQKLQHFKDFNASIGMNSGFGDQQAAKSLNLMINAGGGRLAGVQPPVSWAQYLSPTYWANKAETAESIPPEVKSQMIDLAKKAAQGSNDSINLVRQSKLAGMAAGGIPIDNKHVQASFVNPYDSIGLSSQSGAPALQPSTSKLNADDMQKLQAVNQNLKSGKYDSDPATKAYAIKTLTAAGIH